MQTENQASQHPLKRYGGVLGITALAGGLAGGASAVVAVLVGPSSLLSLAVTAVVFSVGIGVGLWACLRWWRGLDEAAQEAHKWAWWWGSTGGLAFGGVILMVFRVATIEQDATLSMAPQELIYFTALGTVLFQGLGYAIAWTVWWLKRR